MGLGALPSLTGVFATALVTVDAAASGMAATAPATPTTAAANAATEVRLRAVRFRRCSAERTDERDRGDIGVMCRR